MIYSFIPRLYLAESFFFLVSSKCSFFQLSGEGAEEKALALDGTDMGGWNVVVKVLPHEDLEFTTDQLAAMSISHFKKTR